MIIIIASAKEPFGMKVQEDTLSHPLVERVDGNDDVI